MYDAYLLRGDITLQLAAQPHFAGQTTHNVFLMIAMACLFVSAKYLEKTYPGINQLLHYTRVPFTYD